MIKSKNVVFRIKRRLQRKIEYAFPQISFHYGRYNGDYDRDLKSLCDFLWYDKQLIKDCFDSDNKALVDRANNICNHEFTLLGSSYVFKNEIDWHYDFKYGVKHKKKVYLIYLFYDQKIQSDIKIPLELSRFNHAITLGLGWRLSQNKKYCIEFVNQVNSWITSNKVGFGVNWTYAMDAAIRAVNWLITFGLMEDYLLKGENKKFRQSIVQSLWEHGCFIFSHLEWLGSKTDSGANHLISDLSGLFTLGILFKNSARGKKWVKLAHENLEFQMERQILSDGVHFERSISYHRLMLEMFLWCWKLAKEANYPFSDSYYHKLIDMQQFVADYIDENGCAPLIGDNDDGRFISSGLLKLTDHSYLIPEYSTNSNNISYIDRYLIDGGFSFPIVKYKLNEAFYKEGGFYFIRNDYAKLSIRAGKLGYKGGHTHNDQLSFELSINGLQIFIDRGTYTYTAEPGMRDMFRSTRMHNVLQLNDFEQNTSYGSFAMNDKTQTEIRKATDCYFEGLHVGYCKQGHTKLAYTRKFSLKDNCLIIEDLMNNADIDDFIRIYFHLSPGLEASYYDDGIEIRHNRKKICNLKYDSSKYDAEIINEKHSPSYGVLVDAYCITIKYFLKNNDYFKSIIEICW